MHNQVFEIQNAHQFEELSLKAFEFQMKNNPIYASYASQILKGKRPVNCYEIPCLPIEFFKTHQIICTKKGIEKIFVSSGTSDRRSKHLISDISIYETSYLKTFNNFYGDITQYCFLSLLPNYRENENSSLIYMIDDLIEKSTNKDSGFYLNDYLNLSQKLIELEADNKKTILFGVSYALLEFASKFPQKLKNTIVIETGGTKGKGEDITKEELHEKLKSAFSLPYIHSEYGMTELLSQSYSSGDGIFKSPSWKKIYVRDVNDPLSVLEDSKTGGINVIDLANINSCPFIATQDLGKTFDNGTFSILGRYDNTDLRGCNLLIE